MKDHHKKPTSYEWQEALRRTEKFECQQKDTTNLREGMTDLYMKSLSAILIKRLWSR